MCARSVLSSNYPMVMSLGPDYTMLYNDAWPPIMGQTKHPWALGRSCREVFSEIWDFVGPQFEIVMTRGETTIVTDRRVLLDRNNHVEECYFTLSWAPVWDDNGHVDGVFITALETTERVIEDRHRQVLRDLASRMAEARNEEEVWRFGAEILDEHRLSIPFAIPI